MIYLTGDVHDKIEGHFQQKIVPLEIDASIKYLKILKKYNISCTLFLNGRLLDKYPNQIKKLFYFNVEIGGHTYNNFGNMNIIRSYIYRKIWRCIYGPKIYQKRDIRKTKSAFEKLGLKMSSWRTHAFASNNKTFDLLRREGVEYVSDLVGKTEPFKKKGLIHLPINIPVDNNAISYGILKPENRDPFVGCTKGRIYPEEWFEILKNRILNNEKNKIDSIILIHPATMEALDYFQIFEKIAKFLSKYKSAKFSEFKLRK